MVINVVYDTHDKRVISDKFKQKLQLVGRLEHVALFTVVFFQCSFQPFYLSDYKRMKRLDIPVDIVTLTRKRHEAVLPAVSLAVYTT